jgi:SAM-dependent methyltransferase
MTRGHREVAAYYDQIVGDAKAAGAGFIWFMGRDHLSPPLSNDDHHALHACNWREASSSRVLSLAHRLGITAGSQALDLGCGIGGPGRDIMRATGATVYGICVSLTQLLNLRGLSRKDGVPYHQVVVADMQRLPVASGSIDAVFSVNAVYHVNDPKSVIAESWRVLRPGGRFGVDDWFTTNCTTTAQLDQLRHNWSTGSLGFHNFDDFEATTRDHFRIVKVVDFTAEAGAFLSEERFGVTYDSQIAPVLLEAFPRLYQYEGYEPGHASMAVADLRDNILYMGTLYRNGGAVYRQIIGEKH